MIYNFNAGPAMLPKEVMQQAHEEFFNWRQLGVSIMEISHRSFDFEALAEQVEQDIRDLLHLPAHYGVLFLAGGARGQFAAIPMNIAEKNQTAAYVQTGLWSEIAITEGQRYVPIKIIANSKPTNFTSITEVNTWEDYNESVYLHYTENETVHGLEFPFIPNVTGGVPLVCDMSSSLMSRPLDVSKFGIIYACAQKNLGIAGITIVILNKALLKKTPHSELPSIWNYAVQLKNKSMYNTPPTFPWYITGLVLQWLKKQGGLPEIAIRNQEKAALLYSFIDKSSFFSNPVTPKYRSQMNVIFNLANRQKEALFLEKAQAAGMYGLKGHKTLGGMRASIYNAMPKEGVQSLIEFMQDFERSYA